VPTLDAAYLIQKVDGLEVCWIRTMKYGIAKSMRRIASWLDFEWQLWRMPKDKLPAPDVVVVSSLSLLTILNGFLLRRRYRCRLILEIRDIWPLTILLKKAALVAGILWCWVWALLRSWVTRYADAIVGTMPNLGAHVAAVLGQPKRTHCRPMGVDETAMCTGDVLPAQYVEKHIPKDKFIVTHAGAIGITNALDTLLDCAESLRDNTKVHFLVVGEGDLRAHYQQKYAHLPNLSFAPRVPKPMVQSVLSHCDLLYFSVHVSEVWKYGQSLNKVIDYMLSGKPVVASYTGYPSMINEADCGSYVPAGDVAQRAG